MSDDARRTPKPSLANSCNSAYTSARAARSMPRVGSSRSKTFGDENRQRASSAFCWLPPLSVRIDTSGVAARTRVRAMSVRAAWRSRSRLIHPQRLTRSSADTVVLASTPNCGKMPSRLRSSGRMTSPASRASDGVVGVYSCPSSQTRPRTSPPCAPTSARRKSVRPAPTSPARPTTSPARTASETSRSVAPASSLRRATESWSTRSSSRALGETAVTRLGGMSRPTMSRTSSRAVSCDAASVVIFLPSRITVTRVARRNTSSSLCET